MSPAPSSRQTMLWAVLFGLAVTQAPLYYSNQHQYFLHGLAAGGRGNLAADDWLSNTADPTPIFSAGVRATYQYLHEWLFYVYHTALAGVYFVALARLAELPKALTPNVRLLFWTLLVLAHSGAARWLSVRLTGVDYPWFLQCGLANQYLLGAGLQPSMFGIFLLVSLVEFGRGRYVRAALWVALAGTVHATYLLPGAMLTAGYMLALALRREYRAALVCGGVALAAVLPVVIYSAMTFAPTSPGQFAESQRILAVQRIPHHCDPARWFDWVAAVQVGWMLLGLVLFRRTPLFTPLVTAATLAVVLSATTMATGSHSLALLFPWRLTAVLVPVATAVILARAADALAQLSRRESQAPDVRVTILAVVAGVLLAAFGVAVPILGMAYRSDDGELPMLEHVRVSKKPGDVYLIPAKFPKVGSGPRGVPSTSFLPPPRADRDANLIPVDLQRFRLHTGAAIYADFKSVPYRDDDVAQWHERLSRVERWHAQGDWAGARDELRQAGVTRVVSAKPIAATWLQLEYRDERYWVYRVR